MYKNLPPLVLLIALIVLACSTNTGQEYPFGPCADLAILDPDEIDLEQAPLWRVSSFLEARDLPSSVEAVELVSASDQMLAELATKQAIKEVRFLSVNNVSFGGMAELQALPSLEILDCEGLSLEDTWMDEIAQIPSLRELYLYGQDQLTNIGFARLSMAASLHELWLDGPNLIDMWVDELISAPNLQRVTLSDAPQLTENAAITLAASMTLKRIDFDNVPLDDEWLRHLSGSASIEELGLKEQSSFTFAGIEYLADLPTLKELDLSGCDVDAAWFEPLGQLAGLVELRLNGIPSVDYQFWDELIPISSLETLEVRSSNISDDHLRHIAMIPNLRKLELSMNPITRAGTTHLKAAPALEQLWLDGCYGLNDLAVRDICEIATLKEIRFGIGGAGSFALGNMAMRFLSEKQSLQNLTIARFSGLSNADLELLVRPLPNLRRLTLIECHSIDGRFVTYLARAGSCLDRLSIQDCAGVSASSLGEIDRLKNLVRLEIAGVGTDALMQILSTLPRLERLD
ncbi:MAG: hypothetical protein KDB07_08330, partial [Planctomycetes bacterium]|nr:hypothetical protein [Planctomycetota bacterium]